MKRVLIVAAQRNFRDEELFEPLHLFSESGYQVTTASTATGPIRGSEGGWARADILVAQARARDYDAVVFVGGGGALDLHADKAAHRLAREAYEADRVVAAICVAPVILARAGLLRDRPATCFPTEAEKLKALGAEYTDDLVVVSGRIVTGNGPAAAAEFARAVIDRVEAGG